VTANKLEIN